MYEMLTFRCDEESIVNAELKEKIEELERAAESNKEVLDFCLPFCFLSKYGRY